MTIRFVAYTADGVLRGTVGGDDRLGDQLEMSSTIAVAGLRGPGVVAIPVDDLLLVVTPPETPTPVHAAWHQLRLQVGPYVVEGELPTLPGFDPGRSLIRPSGEFTLLGRVRVTLRGAEDGPADEHPFLWVNRYAVEEVRADIELGQYFPGAHVPETRPVRT